MVQRWKGTRAGEHKGKEQEGKRVEWYKGGRAQGQESTRGKGRRAGRHKGNLFALTPLASYRSPGETFATRSLVV